MQCSAVQFRAWARSQKRTARWWANEWRATKRNSENKKIQEIALRDLLAMVRWFKRDERDGMEQRESSSVCMRNVENMNGQSSHEVQPHIAIVLLVSGRRRRSSGGGGGCLGRRREEEGHEQMIAARRHIAIRMSLRGKQQRVTVMCECERSNATGSSTVHCLQLRLRVPLCPNHLRPVPEVDEGAPLFRRGVVQHGHWLCLLGGDHVQPLFELCL